MRHETAEYSKTDKIVHIIIGYIVFGLGVAFVGESLWEWISLGERQYIIAVFGGIFIGIGCLVLLKVRKQTRAHILASKPGAWSDIPIWENGHIRSQPLFSEHQDQTSNPLPFLWIVSLIFLVACVFFFVLLHNLVLGSLMTIPFIVIFTITIYYTLEFWRFGQLYIIMDPFPGLLGHSVHFNLEIPMSFQMTASYFCTIWCINYYEYKEWMCPRVIWKQETMGCATALTNGITKIEIDFNIPEGLPESSVIAAMGDTAISANNYHIWKLDIRTKGLGINLSRTFMLPVFERDAY